MIRDAEFEEVARRLDALKPFSRKRPRFERIKREIRTEDLRWEVTFEQYLKEEMDRDET